MDKLDLLKAGVFKIKFWNRDHIQFNDEAHIYLKDFKEVEISTSKFIECLDSKFLELKQQKWFQEKVLKGSAQRGSEVHKWTELYDQYIKTNADKIPVPEHKTYCYEYHSFYQKFKNRLDIVGTELIMYSHSLDICGTIDRLYWDKVEQKVVLLDIKTGDPRDSHWYQQLVYKYMLAEWGIEVDTILLLSLKGKYKVHSYDKVSDIRKKKLEADIDYLINKRIKKVKRGKDE